MVTRDCAWLPVVFMVIMVISGYQWFSMVTSGYHWFSIVTRDCAWLSEIVDVVGVFMIISGKKFPTCNKGIQRSS